MSGEYRLELLESRVMLSADGMAGGLTTQGRAQDLDSIGAIEVFYDTRSNASNWMEGQPVKSSVEALDDLFDGLDGEALLVLMSPMDGASEILENGADQDPGFASESHRGTSASKLAEVTAKSGSSIVLDGTSGLGTDSRALATGSSASNLTIGLGFFVDYLIVGGGGSGGTPGSENSGENHFGTGGGGGGGVVVTAGVQLVPASYSITVGAGGNAPNYSSSTSNRGNNGEQSSFSSVVALGGGGGGGGAERFSGDGANGASGGGGGGYGTNSGGSALTTYGSQGYAGGVSTDSSSKNRGAGGGGGGAGGAGSNASQSSTDGGQGGAGLNSSISGASTVYGGGGGGGAINTNLFGSEKAGPSGSGGGGQGGFIWIWVGGRIGRVSGRLQHLRSVGVPDELGEALPRRLTRSSLRVLPSFC